MKKTLAIIMLVLLIVTPMLSWASVDYYDKNHRCNATKNKGFYHYAESTTYEDAGVGQHSLVWRKKKIFTCCNSSSTVQKNVLLTEGCNDSEGRKWIRGTEQDTVKCSKCHRWHEVEHKHQYITICNQYFVNQKKGWYTQRQCVCGKKNAGDYSLDKPAK